MPRHHTLNQEAAAEHAVVLADQVGAADLPFAVERARRTGDREHVAGSLRRVAVHVEIERVAGAHLAGQLDGVEITIDGQGDDRAGLRRSRRGDGPDDGRVVTLVDPVVGAEVPQAIPDDESAERHAGVRLMRDVRDLRGRGWSLVGGAVVGLERAAFAESEERSAELIAAALGQHVDHAARHAAVFGRQAAGLHFDFLNEVVVQRLAFVAQLDAGRIQTVDDVLVFRARRSVDDRSNHVGRHAWRHRGQGVEVAAHRQLVEHFRGDADARGRRGRVDRRRRRLDRDRFGDAGERHLEIQGNRTIEADVDRLFDRLEAGELGFHRVVTGGEAGKTIVAFTVGDLGLGALHGRAGDRDGDAWQ